MTDTPFSGIGRDPHDAGLLPYPKRDDVLDLSVTARDALADARTGKNGRQLSSGCCGGLSSDDLPATKM